MNIINTKIPDVTKENIDQSKLRLSDNIIQNILPLFDEVYKSKIEELKKSKNELKLKKIQVIENKEELQNQLNNYNKKKKVEKLVYRISKLINSGLVYEGSLKRETIILLKVVNKLTNEKIEHHMLETLKLINKRFS